MKSFRLSDRLTINTGRLADRPGQTRGVQFLVGYNPQRMWVNVRYPYRQVPGLKVYTLQLPRWLKKVIHDWQMQPQPVPQGEPQ